MNETKRELLTIMDEFMKTDTPGYLAMLAVCYVAAGKDDMSAPIGYSRGDFKRGIRVLREIQGDAPDPQRIESAAALIRQEWLHREDA